MGRPSIDPALMIRMLIVGYVFAIRSRAGLVPRGPGQSGVSMVLRLEHCKSQRQFIQVRTGKDAAQGMFSSVQVFLRRTRSVG
jgi:hypothetical protein